MNRGSTYFAELQMSCSSWKAHGTQCNPQRDLPACHLQRLFFPPLHFRLAILVVLSQATAAQNSWDELSLMCEPELSGGKNWMRERSEGETFQNCVYLNQHSYFRIEAQRILPVGEISPNFQFWIVRAPTSLLEESNCVCCPSTITWATELSFSIKY